jgi:hypothetical protein
MPFKTSRLLRHGRPRPSARLGISPTNGPNTAHCSSVSSIVPASSTEAAYHLFMRWLVGNHWRQNPVSAYLSLRLSKWG